MEAGYRCTVDGEFLVQRVATVLFFAVQYSYVAIPDICIALPAEEVVILVASVLSQAGKEDPAMPAQALL